MNTIKASADIDRLFKEGRRGTSRLVLVLGLPTPEARDPSQGRVLFVAGKKLGNAILRNRSKRVLRAACRRVGGPWPGVDIALVARPGLATAAPEQVDRDLREALSRVRSTK
ncbi:MAG: ribonuclease P protein component [Actinobacteria bacterium HGW-Actinobacteria-1]|nr:MAG: ribonuclease P protein component [Actinobacteria bacterium HGW-Actinobacteria-1]